MVQDPSCPRRRRHSGLFTPLVAVAIILALLLTGPGNSELWAAVADDVPVASGVGETVGSLPAAQAPQVFLGGSAFKTAAVPATALPAAANVGIGAGALNAPSAQVPAALDSEAAPPSEDLQSESSAGAAAPVLGSQSRAAVSRAADALSPDRIGSLSSEDAQAGGEKLQALIGGGTAAPETGAPPVAAAAAQEGLPALAARAAFAGRASVPAANGVLPVPSPGSSNHPALSPRVVVAQAQLWVKSFWHFFVVLSADNWREYKAQVAEAASRHPLSVSDPRAFFADSRLVGVAGGFHTYGLTLGARLFVARDAIRVFTRYFPAAASDRKTEVAFLHFLARADQYNGLRRYTELHKQLRKTLREASLLPTERLADFFDSKVSDAQTQGLSSYQQGGAMRADILRVREALVETMNEEPAGAPGRIVAAVVRGSFGSLAATPTSDVDMQLVSADGGSGRINGFVERLKARLKGFPHPVGADPFALPPSLGLLMLRVQDEPYFVVSPDAELERSLSPPQGFDPSPELKNPGGSRRAARGLLHALLIGFTYAADLKDRFSAPRPAAAAPAGQAFDEKTRKRALTGWLVARTLYLAGFILAGVIAYPILAQEAVGRQGYSDLMSLGSLAAIALASFSGTIVDKLSYRDTFALNTAVRLVVAVATPLLFYAHVLTFWPMLIVSLANGWNISSSLIAEDKLMPFLAGSDARKLTAINAAANINFIALNVLLGIFLGAGHWVDALMAHFGKLGGLSVVFLINAATCAAGFVIQWFTIPDVLPARPKKAAAAARPLDKRKLAVWGGVLSVGTGLYFLLHALAPQFATLPLVAAMLIGLVTTSDGFKRLWSGKILRVGGILGMLYAFVVYPAQSMLVPFLAKDLSGGALLQGRLQGALFFGQLLAGSTLLKLPGRWNALVQGAVLASFGAWLAFYLFPHNLLLAAGAMGVILALHAAAQRLTNRGWMRFAFVGLSFIAVPLLFWGNIPMLLLSILMVGLVNAPNKITIDSVMQSEAKEGDPENAGLILGVRSALVNVATAFGYASFSAVSSSFTPMFPGMLKPVAAAFAVVALVFWLAPRWLGKRVASANFQPGPWKWLPWTKNGPLLPSLRIGARRAASALAASWLGAASAAPGLSRSDLKLLLAQRLKSGGVKAVVVDYDGTLMDKTADNKAVPASDELVSLIKSLRAAGIQVVVSTNHFFDGDGNSMTSLLGDRLDARTRAGMMFVVQSGSRIFEYGPNGEKPAEAAWTQTEFDDADRARLGPAFEQAAAQAGLSPEDYKLFNESSRTLMEVRGKQERVDAVFAALSAANSKNGWSYIAQLKPYPTMRENRVPYVQFTKANKGTGTKQAYELLRARGAVQSDKQLLILGDAFEAPEGNDLTMARALPGATAIAVGSPSEARQPNVFQSAATGAAATHDVFRDLLSLVGNPSVVGPNSK